MAPAEKPNSSLHACRSLSLNCTWEPGDVPGLCRALAKLTQLTKLDLHANLARGDDILASVSNLNQLTALLLSDSQRESSSSKALRRAVNALPCLCELSLGSSEIAHSEGPWSRLSIASLIRLVLQQTRTLTTQRDAAKGLVAIFMYGRRPHAAICAELQASPEGIPQLFGLIASCAASSSSKPDLLMLQSHITHALWYMSCYNYVEEGLWVHLQQRVQVLSALLRVVGDPRVSLNTCSNTVHIGLQAIAVVSRRSYVE